jgi:hypothetical protein
MTRSGKSGLTAGVLLIAVGFVLLAARLTGMSTAPLWLLGIGLALALLGIFKRSFGLLLGGLIPLGVGAGMVLGDRGAEGVPLNTWLLLATGCALVASYLLALLLQMRVHWWPVLAGAVLLVLAGLRIAHRFVLLPPEVVIAVREWWPLALVAGGLFLVVRALRR